MEDSNYVGHPMGLRMYSMSPRIIGIIPHRQFSQNNDFEECAVTDITTAAITVEEVMSENAGCAGVGEGRRKQREVRSKAVLTSRESDRGP